DLEAGEAAAVEVEEAHVVQHRARAHPRAEEPQPKGAQLREEAGAIGHHRQRVEAETRRLLPADLVEGLHAPPSRSARRNRTSRPKYSIESRRPRTVECLSVRRMYAPGISTMRRPRRAERTMNSVSQNQRRSSIALITGSRASRRKNL